MSLAREKYVSLETFRKSGVAVPSPVWIVPLPEGRLGLTTAPDAGKVKRLRNNPEVRLTPCDMRGRVRPGAPTVTGTARVVFDGPELAKVRSELRAKYGPLAWAVELGGRLKAVIARGDHTAAVIVELNA
ncbi:PPOX class F420-dependent oxidoreductase [Tsukamurella sp. 8F]|uniref:PPOX class F420-dependent oxidoreductase n=1 Tax=unclassified Tsukamurella TaxID=2633480 RepID=UPI0023B99A93|nr:MULTISPECIES: PPOX class F420-dependent oxidoreductase [unclassified Tsukamurella]MDF0532228.1 PPOX class F420-dependent oxidoreductase [Tsukamurella sp. 8J]MDF0588067.1 PPOX class F420-dependent oxidoreductase [Tsukamurella sp. 8F]